ncbi:hypothetical protein B0T13DRAFT_449707 [Neurospora crassa]|nr:hypothetical protein B0T13DRAFT_449707 [Neurospora crassa]
MPPPPACNWVLLWRLLIDCPITPKPQSSQTTDPSFLCFGAGETVVLGGRCTGVFVEFAPSIPNPPFPRTATTEQPQHHYREEGDARFALACQLPYQAWRAVCRVFLRQWGSLGGKCDPEQLGSFDRGRPSCSTRVGKLGPSRFRFHSGNAQHPASEAVSPLSVSHGEASLKSTFSYNTSPPAGPTQRRSVPRPQAKAKQFNPRAVQTIRYQHQA